MKRLAFWLCRSKDQGRLAQSATYTMNTSCLQVMLYAVCAVRGADISCSCMCLLRIKGGSTGICVGTCHVGPRVCQGARWMWLCDQFCAAAPAALSLCHCIQFPQSPGQLARMSLPTVVQECPGPEFQGCAAGCDVPALCWDLALCWQSGYDGAEDSPSNAVSYADAQL